MGQDVAKKPGLGLLMAGVWFVYLVMKPVYLFPKGLPQISDIVLTAGMIPVAVTMFMNAGARVSYVTITGVMFAALCAAVNTVNYFFLPDMKFILAALYYPYNVLIFLFVVFLFRRDPERMARVTVAGIVISLGLQLFSAEFFPKLGGSRLTGNFKNPNQLAYWALLSAACLVFLRREKIGIVEFAAIAIAAYLQTLALSKAGIIAFGVFGIVLCFLPQVPRAAKIVLFFAIMAAGSYLFFSNHKDYGQAVERVTARLETIGAEQDDSLEGRGYDRILQRPEYLLTGAGEGGYERFKTWGGPNELHSGLATILFSYGMLGFALFSSFLYFIFYRQGWRYTAVLFAVLLFSLTSQTIRFTHTWVFLGIAYGTFITRAQEEGEEPGGLPAVQNPLRP